MKRSAFLFYSISSDSYPLFKFITPYVESSLNVANSSSRHSRDGKLLHEDGHQVEINM
jgi:hypothetical protein